MINTWAKALKKYLGQETSLPNDFLPDQGYDGNSSMFLASCIKDEILFIEDSIETLCGYTADQLKNGGLDFWFSLIHPEDLPQVSSSVVKVHELLIMEGFDKAAATPMKLMYRIKHANDTWIWIEDIRSLVTDNKKQIDKIIGRFQLADTVVTAAEIKRRLEEGDICTRALEVAIVHQNDSTKKLIDNTAIRPSPLPAKQFPKLTKREKEILRLVAQGYSTKMIADKCCISISTVETHRRHLLEKLDVKNSMELVNEASKLYWL